MLRDWTNGCDTRNVTATRPYCFLSNQDWNMHNTLIIYKMLVWQFFKTSSWYFRRFFIPVINKLLSWKLSVKQTGYGFLLRFKAANHPCRKVLVTQSGSRCKNCSFKLFAPTRHIVFAYYVLFFFLFPFAISVLYLFHAYIVVLVAHSFIIASDPNLIWHLISVPLYIS